MFKKISIVSLIVLALAVLLTGIALADQHDPQPGRRGRGGKGYAGTVTNVDSAASEFSIENREGEILTFSVNDDTNFASPDGELESFDDLVVDMAVGVNAADSDEDALIANGVRYLDPELFEAEHAGGEVISIGTNSFTVNTREDEELTFQVDASTHYDGMEGLDDLEEGMKVGVAYSDEGGALLALGVKAMKPKQCGDGPRSGAGDLGERRGRGQRPSGDPEGSGRPAGPNGAQS